MDDPMMFVPFFDDMPAARALPYCLLVLNGVMKNETRLDCLPGLFRGCFRLPIDRLTPEKAGNGGRPYPEN